jgi:hypothetical protein
MFAKSLKTFFKNPLITLPNILFLLLYKIFLDWYLDVSGLTSADFGDDIANAADMQKAATFIAVFLLVLVLAVFVTALITSWTNTMCKYAVDGQPVNIFKALKEALKYYWRLLGVIVLIAAIFIGISIVLVIACIPLLFSLRDSINAASIIAIVAFSFIFFLGIIFLSICFTPVQILLVYDNLGIGESFSKGFKFGIKKFFPILGVVLLVILASLIINLPLEFGLHASENTVLSYITSAVSTYFSIFTVVYIMNSYKNSKPQEIVDMPSQENMQDLIVNNENPPEEKSNFRI